MSRAIKTILRKTRALDVISHMTASDRLDILLYHGVCESAERDGFGRFVPVDQFEEHLRVLLRYGRPISLEDVTRTHASGVVITFDDGYANNYDLGFAILQKYRIPATVFLTTGFIDRTVPLWADWLLFLLMAAPRRNSTLEWKGSQIRLPLGESRPDLDIYYAVRKQLHGDTVDQIRDFLCRLEDHLGIRYNWSGLPPALRPLSWEDVRAMRSSGLISFGAHTVSHPKLAQCAPEVQRAEILESKRRIEQELGEPCLTFAYPYGKPTDYTQVTKQIIETVGFKLALSAENGFNRMSALDRCELKRWGADISGDELSFIVSGAPVWSQFLSRRAQAGH